MRWSRAGVIHCPFRGTICGGWIGAGEQRGIRSVLVEAAFQNQVPLSDMFEICSRMAAMPVPGDLEIAFFYL